MTSGLLEVRINRAEIEDLSRFFKKNYAASAVAATQSIKETTAVILLKGRINIQGSGAFSGPWIRGLQSRQYPRGKNSPNAKSYINHRLGGLASVFEFGASIRPKRGRYLWLLAPGAPKRMTLGANFGAGWINKTRGRTTPQRLGAATGKLEYVVSKRGFPMLGVTAGRGKRAHFKPYFIGIPFAKIEKRWSVTVSQKGAEALAQATSQASENSQAVKDGLAAGDTVAKALADDANRAADALGRAADNAARIQVPDRSAIFERSGGSGNSGYAEGGFVSGAGTSTSDSIPALLSNGEFVVRASKVGQPGVLGFLHALNGGISLPSLFGRRRFAEGGLVGAIPAAAGASSSDRSLTLVLDNKTFGGFSGSRDAMDNLERYAIQRRLSATTKRAPSRIG